MATCGTGLNNGVRNRICNLGHCGDWSTVVILDIPLTKERKRSSRRKDDRARDINPDRVSIYLGDDGGAEDV